MPGLWAGCMVCLSFARDVGLCQFACWPVCGVWFVVSLRMPCLWAWFIWLVCLLAFVGFLYRADAPFPIFIGEVLSVFRFIWEPWLLVFVLFLVVCGALPFWK